MSDAFVKIIDTCKDPKDIFSAAKGLSRFNPNLPIKVTHAALKWLESYITNFGYEKKFTLGDLTNLVQSIPKPHDETLKPYIN